MKAEDLKRIVKEKYGSIASQSNIFQDRGCCDSSGCCGDQEFSMTGDEYTSVAGYNPDADLGLGCGLPTGFAGLKPGDSALDLGSGAGNDCFIARTLVGETGRVTGLDFSEEMLEKAKQNLEKMLLKCTQDAYRVRPKNRNTLTLLKRIKNSGAGIYSVTLTARKQPK